MTTRSDARRDDVRDRGIVLPIVLVLAIVGSLVVVALLSFVMVAFRARPPIEARSNALESVKSAMRMAATMQTDNGLDGCFQPSTSFDINGRTVTVDCSLIFAQTSEGGRYGIVTTRNGGVPDPADPAIRSTGGAASVIGSVLLNGGHIADSLPNVEIVDPPGGLDGGSVSATDYASASSDGPTTPLRYAALDEAVDVEFAALPECIAVFGGPALTDDLVVEPFDDGGGDDGGGDDGGVDGGGDGAVDGGDDGGGDDGGVDGGGDDGGVDGGAVDGGAVDGGDDGGGDDGGVDGGDDSSGDAGDVEAAQVSTGNTITTTAIDQIEIRRDGSEPGRILGIIVSDGAGSWTLDRSSSDEDGTRFDVTLAPDVDSDPVRVCYELVDVDDPDAIPRTATFCSSPIAARPAGFDCEPSAPGDTNGWWTKAGRQNTTTDPFVYPYLPEIPLDVRAGDAFFAPSTDCRMLFPGIYRSDVTLSGPGRFYLGSGTYLFEGTLRIDAGASVVAGDGPVAGCANDQSARFQAATRLEPGSGATLLLGEQGRIEVDNASFVVSERRATREIGAIGMSVMSVNEASDQASGRSDVEIPYHDRVLLDGECSTAARDAASDCDITTYVRQESTGAPERRYVASELGADDDIIAINLDADSADVVRFGGAVFTPNAAVDVTAQDGSNVDFSAGLTASTVELSMDQPGRVTFGRDTEIVAQRVRLQGRTTYLAKGETENVRSSMLLEYNKNELFAINSWTIATD